jgi:predicted RNA binding protein YcfA (HicA-like mRNA interferase family)
VTKKVFEVIEKLEAGGWAYVRTRGDHHKFSKPGARRSVVIPGKRNDTIPPGTLAAILCETGLKLE